MDLRVFSAKAIAPANRTPQWIRFGVRARTVGFCYNLLNKTFKLRLSSRPLYGLGPKLS